MKLRRSPLVSAQALCHQWQNWGKYINNDDDGETMMSQCDAVVHDGVFVIADTKVLYNQPAHLEINSKSVW